jgi:hypothetical protein
MHVQRYACDSEVSPCCCRVSESGRGRRLPPQPRALPLLPKNNLAGQQHKLSTGVVPRLSTMSKMILIQTIQSFRRFNHSRASQLIHRMSKWEHLRHNTSNLFAHAKFLGSYCRGSLLYSSISYSPSREACICMTLPQVTCRYRQHGSRLQSFAFLAVVVLLSSKKRLSCLLI